MSSCRTSRSTWSGSIYLLPTLTLRSSACSMLMLFYLCSLFTLMTLHEIKTCRHVYKMKCSFETMNAMKQDERWSCSLLYHTHRSTSITITTVATATYCSAGLPYLEFDTEITIHPCASSFIQPRSTLMKRSALRSAISTHNNIILCSQSFSCCL